MTQKHEMKRQICINSGTFGYVGKTKYESLGEFGVVNEIPLKFCGG